MKKSKDYLQEACEIASGRLKITPSKQHLIALLKEIQDIQMNNQDSNARNTSMLLSLFKPIK